MKLLTRLFLLLGLLTASPAFAETVIVHEGGPESADVATRFAGAYNVQHADFYVNSSAAATIANLEANIASTTSHAPAIVTMYANDIENYASAALWVAAYNTHIANVRAAVPGVQIAVITPLPKSGSTSALRTAIGLLRAEERNEIDWIIDFAANPSINDKTAPYTQIANANIYSGDILTACTTACTLSAYTNTCLNTVTTGGSKGNDYATKQYFCALESILANKYPWTVYEQPVVYSSSPVVPSTDPPFYTLAAQDDIASGFTTSTWLTTSGWSALAIPPGSEKKFRTQLNEMKVGRFDPMRAPGQSISGHCHTFFGNSTVTGSSTYKSLRTDQTPGNSGAAGGLLNLTGYWNPCLTVTNALGDGVTRVKKGNLMTLYYVGWRDSLTMWDRPRGFTEIFGTNMDDYDDTRDKGELGANAGWVGNGWKASNTGTVGWQCTSTGESHNILANFDGTDAFTTPCPSSSSMYAIVAGRGCMDGVNLRSATGYGHTRNIVRNNSSGQLTCADNWYPMVQVIEKTNYTFAATGDMKNVRLDSDDAAGLTATPPSTLRNGSSYHGDWFGAWDYPTMQAWMHYCNGSKSTSTDSFTPHECDSSTIDGTNRMKGGVNGDNAPDGSRTPQVVLSNNFNGDVSNEWWDLPGTSSSPTGSGHQNRLRLHKKN